MGGGGGGDDDGFAVETVVLLPSQRVKVSFNVATSRYDKLLLAQAIISPASSVVVNGNGFPSVVAGGAVVEGGGMVRLV